MIVVEIVELIVRAVPLPKFGYNDAWNTGVYVSLPINFGANKNYFHSLSANEMPDVGEVSHLSVMHNLYRKILVLSFISGSAF